MHIHMWSDIPISSGLQYVGSSVIDQNKSLSLVRVCASYISLWAMPARCLCHTNHNVCCICLDAVFRTLVVAHPLFYSCVVQSHCFSITSPSFIDVCLVLFCSASSSLLLLHPVWAACTWGLFVFSAVPVPPPPGVNIEEHIQIRQEEKRQRINRRHRLEEGRGMDQG